jgi:hypothetical protein
MAPLKYKYRKYNHTFGARGGLGKLSTFPTAERMLSGYSVGAGGALAVFSRSRILRCDAIRLADVDFAASPRARRPPKPPPGGSCCNSRPSAGNRGRGLTPYSWRRAENFSPNSWPGRELGELVAAGPASPATFVHIKSRRRGSTARMRRATSGDLVARRRCVLMPTAQAAVSSAAWCWP